MPPSCRSAPDGLRCQGKIDAVMTDAPPPAKSGTFRSVLIALIVVGVLIVASREALPPKHPVLPTPTPATPTAAPSPTPTSTLPPGPCGPALLKPNGDPWNCTFSDDFDETTLDPSKWSPLTTARTGLNNGRDCWVSSPQNIALRDGTLRLTTRREAHPF